MIKPNSSLMLMERMEKSNDLSLNEPHSKTLFRVNSSAKDRLVEYAKSYTWPQRRGYVWLYRVLYAIIVAFMVALCSFLVPRMVGYGGVDAFGYLIVLVFAFCIAMLLSIIPMCIKSATRKKFLWKWNGRTHESVSLHKGYVIWSHCDLCEDGKLRYQPAGEVYTQFKMLYANIKKMEYNKAEKILYVYGYMSGIEYENPYKGRVLETIEVDRTLEVVPWFTLPEYFESFDLLKSELEQRTGMRIREV